MHPSNRRKAFRKAVEQLLDTPGRRLHYTEMYGFANGARFVDGGLLIGVVNLDRFNGSADGLVLISVIDASPDDHVYFAVVIPRDGVHRVLERLNSHPGRLNNVRMNILKDGRVYVDAAGFSSTLVVEDGFDPSQAEPFVPVEKIIYSIYQSGSTANRNLMAGQFVGYLAELVGRDRVEEISPWGTDESVLGPMMRRMPAEVPLGEIERAISMLGGFYTDYLVERYHVALNFLPSKHFVILAGLSGTGKTSLARRYAQAVHGIYDPDGQDPLFFISPVRPDWTDPTGLLGYYDVISNRYVVPKFLEAVIAAVTYRGSPVFVCIDELNNARVEYYFADVLSAMESGLGLPLHSHSTPLTGTTGGEIPATIPLPSNLFIIGTINVDETTQPISDKVLDRAVVLDMSQVNLAGYFDMLAAREPNLLPAIERCRGVLQSIHDLLASQYLGFGYRVAEEFVRYFSAALRLGQRLDFSIIDDQLTQKILVKLRGGERERSMLVQLLSAVDAYPRAVATIQRLLAELDEYGSFQSMR